MMIKTVTRTALAILALACFAATPGMADISNYKVEVLVFNYLPSDTLNDELWPVINEVPPRANTRNLAYNKAGQPINFFTRLPKSELELSQKQASLRRSRDYRVLFHEAWVQPIGEKKGKDTIHITGGDILDNGLYELEGYIAIDKARYLHFRSDLFHSRQLTAAEAQRLNPVIPAEPGQAENNSPDTDDTSPASNQPSTNGNRYLTRSDVPDFLTVEMKTGRRMRSKELHYLDHPLMGALVLITPTDK